MKNIISEFLEDEISIQEAYEAIYSFITSENIRSGEYEGNRYIIKKMDLINFIIFIEDIYQDGIRGICNCTSIYKNELLNAINDFARNKGYIE